MLVLAALLAALLGLGLIYTAKTVLYCKRARRAKNKVLEAYKLGDSWKYKD